MDGITILNTYVSNNYPLFTLFSYALGIVSIIVCIMIIVVSVQNDECHPFILFIALSVGLFFLRCGYASHRLPDQTKYQITVDDSVSFNDFMERYEIINQDGKIYTVIEKEE